MTADHSEQCVVLVVQLAVELVNGPTLGDRAMLTRGRLAAALWAIDLVHSPPEAEEIEWLETEHGISCPPVPDETDADLEEWFARIEATEHENGEADQGRGSNGHPKGQAAQHPARSTDAILSADDQVVHRGAR